MVVGNTIRVKRKLDFYGEETLMSENESQEYFYFVEKILSKVEKVIF